MDAAVETYKKETKHTEPVVESTFKEEGIFGEDGWSISRSADFKDK